MTGSGPDDGDILAMGPDRPPHRWASRWAGPWVIGRRSRLALAVAGACALLIAAGTFAAVRLSAPTPADRALARLVAQVTTVPVGVWAPGNLDSSANLNVSVNSFGSATSASATSMAIALGFAPAAANGPPLTAGGKPEVFYAATEYCPYCDVENWALIMALSRFGTFSGLSTSRSPYFEDIPPVDGWTFYGSSYTSRYLAFVPVETHSAVLVSPKADPAKASSYRALQPLTAAQQVLLGRYDKGGETPFFDFGGRATLIGATVQPTLLAGMTWSQIAADLRRPATPAGATILTAANLLTSEFCKLTNDRPAAACPSWAR